MKLKHFALLIGSSFLCTGCFDISLDLWVKSDGSGRSRASVRLSQSISQTKVGKECLVRIRKELSTFLTKNFGESGTAVLREYDKDDYHYLEVTVEGRNLGSASKANANNKLIRLSNGNFYFLMTMPEATKKPGFFGEPMLSDNYLTVRIHGARIVRSNGVIENNRKTSTWRVSLADLLKGNTGREFRAELVPL